MLRSSDLFVLYSYQSSPGESHTGQPYEIPIIVPAIVKFTPEVKDSRPILPEDIERWRSRPDDLVGNCFKRWCVGLRGGWLTNVWRL
jgi:hypothetical protein